MLRNVAACDSFFKDFDEQAAVAEVQKKFKKFLEDAEVTVLDLDDADAGAIFKAYFERTANAG
jgi:hypothetical protein